MTLEVCLSLMLCVFAGNGCVRVGVFSFEPLQSGVSKIIGIALTSPFLN